MSARVQQRGSRDAVAVDKLRAVALEASEQSERLTVPYVSVPAQGSDSAGGTNLALVVSEWLETPGATGSRAVVICEERSDVTTPLLTCLQQLTLGEVAHR